MRVGIDIRRMYDFGIATYIRNVVRTLGRIDTTNEYFLIGDTDRAHDFGELPENFHVVPVTSAQVTLRTYLEFHRLIRQNHLDLLHVPHTFWRPLPVSCPYVITVHDLLDYLYRAHTNSPFSRYVHSYMTRQVMYRASRILAVSNFTKKDVSRYFRVRPEKIKVVYNAPDDSFLLGHSTLSERESIYERYQINYPFILYAGRISPHKNVSRIIEAFSALKSELSKENALPDLKLIIIGDEVSKHPDLRRAVIRSGVQHDVRFLGYVPIDVLRIFYDAAKVFVFPSLYEGFGLPPLEAMAHGTPIVTSNTSALPEVVGNAGLLVNPENVFEISRALYRALMDSSLRERLKAAGTEQARTFSWEKSVRQIITVYEEIVSEQSGRNRQK